MSLFKRSFKLKRLLPALAIAATLFAPACYVSAQQDTPTGAGGRRLSAPDAQSPEKNKQEVDENDQYLHSPAVGKLGAMVGLNTEQAATAFTAANFVVLAGFIGWFLVKTLPKTFRGRSTIITTSATPKISMRYSAKSRNSSEPPIITRAASATPNRPGHCGARGLARAVRHRSPMRPVPDGRGTGGNWRNASVG